MTDYHFTHDWAVVRDAYMRWTDPSTDRSKLPIRVQRLFNSWSGGWSGATIDQAREWTARGYEPPALDTGAVASLSSDVDKPRWIWSDDPEGEFDHDLYSSGEVDCYRSRTKRAQRVGINVEMGFGFHAGMKASTIADYANWVGSVLQAIQRQGFDVALSLFYEGTNTYRGGSNDRVSIQVARFGERVMFREWSALFSPAGFRHLFFAAIVVAEETDPPVKAAEGLGSPKHRKYAVTFDKATRTLRFDNAQGPFPADQMSAEFEAARQSF